VSSSLQVERIITVPVEAPEHVTDRALAKSLVETLRIPLWSPFQLLRPRATTAHAQRAPDKAPGGRAKRAIDLVIAGTAVLVMAPLLALVSLGVRLMLGGPVLYTQRRIGLGGRSFPCYKFRTMVLDADAVLRRHLEDDPEAAREWQETQKLKNDPRVTPFGHLLRKSSIDELPQLFNVLRGDMSCIGPRPVLAAELERYSAHANEYRSARPGLTGLWQVSGRNRLSYRDRVALDRLYVRRWSLGLDLVILLRTIPAVMRLDETS
jgi:exopolysaccharide production protein ExoY